MSWVHPTLVRSTHAVALALALGALALSLRESALFLPFLVLAALALATPFVEWTSVPPSLQRTLPRAHVLALLVAALVAWFSRSMGVLVLAPEAIPLAAGPFLVPIWAVFALAPRAFPAGRTLVPAIAAVLTFAGLNPAPAGYGGTRLAFLQGGDRNGFAEIYLALAILTVAVLWVAALLGSGPRWSRRTVVVVVVTGVLAVGLAATGVVGLPLAQPHVERAFAAALDQAATGLSGESTLGDIGALSLSRRRVLDLQTALPSGGHWRLPSEVFTRFDGRRWTNAAPPARAPAPRGAPGVPSPAARAAESPRPRVLFPSPAPEGAGDLTSDLGSWFPVSGPTEEGASDRAGPRVELRVTQAQVADWPLLLPRHPEAVTANASNLNVDRFGLVRRPRGLPLRQYGAVLALGGSVSPGASTEASGIVPTELSPEEREETLSLPPSVDPGVVSLATSLAPASATAREKLAATVHDLQTQYRYSLSPGPFRPDGDPLAEFLFEKKEGYCEYFASAAVVLLRLQGVPARFVKGLSVGPQTDVGGGLHVVRESDAHAWIEAWLPGEGWVEADPTPPGQFESARGTPGRWQRSIEHARAAASGAWSRLTEGGPLRFLRWAGTAVVSLAGRLVREPLSWLVALAAVLGPPLVRRLHRLLHRGPRATGGDPPAVPADLRALVGDLERRWAAHDRPRPPGHGLLEHGTSLAAPPPPGRAPVPAPLVEAGVSIVRFYYRARFGGEAPSPEELRQLRDRLRG